MKGELIIVNVRKKKNELCERAREMYYNLGHWKINDEYNHLKK